MVLWKVNCLENEFPGMWQRWFLHQSVGIGWPPQGGFHLDGPTDGGRGWSQARNALKEISIGDYIVVALRGHRVGRLGVVTKKAISDAEWEPLVPPSRDLPHGEMGRRILVRWDLTVGPDNRDLIVALPSDARFNLGELRPTVARIRSRSRKDLIDVMSNQRTWVGLLTHFDRERALSGYIAAYPHRLEDGLLPHPNDKVRERVFDDRSRLDVLLTDRRNVSVIVECKQGSPTIDHITQLWHYMERLKRETGIKPRGILVHGGARKLAPEVAKEARKRPAVEMVQYTVEVDFSSSG